MGTILTSEEPARIQNSTGNINTMIRIHCPFCGLRDHSEFSYGGDGSIEYPELDASVDDWLEAVFERENLDGVQLETWQHLHGCRMWIIVERDTTTHKIHSVRPAHKGVAKVLEFERKANERISKEESL